MKYRLFIFFLLLIPFKLSAQFNFSGYVYDSRDKEILIGASVYDSVSERGAVTNAYGFFSIYLNNNTVKLRVSYVGFESKWITITNKTESPIEIYLNEEIMEMQTVVVTAKRDEQAEQVQSTQMSIVNLKPEAIKKLPSFGGETDVLKIAQLLPGITQGNEGSTGIYVRGGTDDQNLVMLDEAVVYNVGHLLGFFSVFNSDALKDVDIQKGSFSAKYGGRLSSVMDIRMADGSADRWNVHSGIGLLTSRLMIDGPIIKDKMSIMVAGRRTYIDKVFSLFDIPLPYYFYDLNAKINFKLNPSNRFYLSTYLGSDVFDVSGEEENEDGEIGQVGLGFNLGNITSTFRWNHVYDIGNLFSNLTIHQTRFSYTLYGTALENTLNMSSRIQDYGAKADWEWYPSTTNKVFWGAGLVSHAFRPNVLQTSGEINAFIESKEGQRLGMNEYHVHLSNDWDINSLLKMSSGIRFAGVLATKKYAGFEPRWAMRIKLHDRHSIKIGYNRMQQFMHRVSSGSFVLPTDLWYPVTENVAPQFANHLNAGYFGTTLAQNYSFSIEVFYKKMSNLIEYREGASLVFNDNFEQELLNGVGTSRGIEFFLQKHTGKLTGWASYTLSKTDRTFEELNFGRTYPDRFDRRHVINISGVWNVAKQISLSANWVFMSGTRITAQTGQFIMPNPSLTGVDLVPIYSSKNAISLSPSHRLDINLIIENTLFGIGKGEWHLSFYNFYNMASPFRVGIVPNGNAFAYTQNGLFGLIPSIAYNVNFSTK